MAALDNDYSVQVGDAATLAMILTRVCKHWRNIGVKDCPELWRRISIGMPLTGQSCHRKKWIRLMTEILKCSHNHTLHITFTCGKEGRLQALGHNVLNVLAKESLRWRHISLSSYACHLVPLQRVVDKIPALTSITIICSLTCLQSYRDL